MSIDGTNEEARVANLGGASSNIALSESTFTISDNYIVDNSTITVSSADSSNLYSVNFKKADNTDEDITQNVGVVIQSANIAVTGGDGGDTLTVADTITELDKATTLDGAKGADFINIAAADENTMKVSAEVVVKGGDIPLPLPALKQKAQAL